MIEAEQIMKRCQVGTLNYEEANNLHAACYGMIGKMLLKLKKLEGQEPVAWRRREVGGGWQYFGWQETGMTHQAVERGNKNGFECEAIPATTPQRTEPVSWEDTVLHQKKLLDEMEALLTKTSAPQRTWVGLTDEEVNNAIKEKNITPLFTYRMIARAIEAKLKEKNNG